MLYRSALYCNKPLHCAVLLQETIHIHTQLVLQPLPLEMLQTIVWRLRLQLQVQKTDVPPASAQRRKLTAKKTKATPEPDFSDPYAASHSVLFKAVASPVGLLALPKVPTDWKTLDVDSMLADGGKLKAVKALFGGDAEQAYKAVQALLQNKNVIVRLMTGDPVGADGGLDAAEAEEQSADVSEVSEDALCHPFATSVLQAQQGSSAALSIPPPPPPRASAPALPAAASFVSDESLAGDAARQVAGSAGAPKKEEHSNRRQHIVRARRASEQAAAAAAAATDTVSDESTVDEAAGQGAGLGAEPESQLSPEQLSPQQLSPEQLSKVLLDLFDVWHTVLTQQQQAHKREQQRVRYQQECEEALLQTGMDPLAAQEEARQTAERRAQQQEEESRASAGKAGGKDGSLWWRQQELPAVFGSSSEEASMQLECVSAAAGELVEKLAGKQGVLSVCMLHLQSACISLTCHCHGA